MKKSSLRKEYKSRRNELSVIEKQSFDLMILQQLKNYPINSFDYLLSYYPIDKHNEPNALMFSKYLKEQIPGIHICKPRINEACLIDAIETDGKTNFKNNLYEIPEPMEDNIVSPSMIDIVFVPLLAFDKKGLRVGYGKGFYDKYLPLCIKPALKIGFSYFQPVDIIDDANEYDIPLNLCFTPFEVYEF